MTPGGGGVNRRQRFAKGVDRHGMPLDRKTANIETANIEAANIETACGPACFPDQGRIPVGTVAVAQECA